MIYTVTLNPAIDKTVEIPDFTAGKVNRIQSLRIDAGGKGINVTKCLANLGMESIAAMLLGGSSGEKIQQMLAEQNIKTLAVSVPGETRTNLKIIDPTGHSNTDINEPGPVVSEEALDALKKTDWPANPGGRCSDPFRQLVEGGQFRYLQNVVRIFPKSGCSRVSGR